MKLLKTSTKFLAASMLAAVVLPASASLIGDDVTVTWFGPDLATTLAGPTTVTVVDPGNEIHCSPGGADPLCTAGGGGNSFTTDTIFDIGADTIFYSQQTRGRANRPAVTFSSATFNGFEFSSLDWVSNPSGIVTGATVITNIAGLDNTRLTFGDHFVRINMQGLTLPANSLADANTRGEFTITLTTSDGNQNPDPEPNPDPQPNPSVPEPASLALLGIGFLGAGYARRRRRK